MTTTITMRGMMGALNASVVTTFRLVLEYRVVIKKISTMQGLLDAALGQRSRFIEQVRKSS